MAQFAESPNQHKPIDWDNELELVMSQQEVMRAYLLLDDFHTTALSTAIDFQIIDKKRAESIFVDINNSYPPDLNNEDSVPVLSELPENTLFLYVPLISFFDNGVLEMPHFKDHTFAAGVRLHYRGKYLDTLFPESKNIVDFLVNPLTLSDILFMFPSEMQDVIDVWTE